jgi:hypothetical protein
VHPHAFGLGHRLPLPPTVGIPAHQLLLLGVHTDNRLGSGQVLAGLLVEVAELGVPVGMLGPLLGLEGALQRVALLLEQPPDGVVADLEPLPAKGIGKLAGGLARPAQRRGGITAGVGVDQLVQRAEQARLALDQSLWPATRTADATARIGRGIQLPHAPIHRWPRQPGEARHARTAATAQRLGGRAGQQAALLLGEVRGDQHIQPAQHGVHVHAGTLTPWHAPTATTGQASHARTP